MNKGSAKSTDVWCVYCHGPGTTKDHIPPKNLFKTSPPDNLITVPACVSCNQRASPDDEWFRAYLVSDHRVSNHPESQELLKAFHRSQQRLQSARFQETLKRGTRRFPLITESGLYCGEGTTLDSDFTQESKCLTRIVKGLFYHEFQILHPQENSIAVYFSQHMRKKREALESTLELIGYIKTENKRIIGNDVFSYGYAIADNDPHATLWVLTFFKSIPFIVFSMPQSQKPG